MRQPAPTTIKTAVYSRVYLGSPDQIRAVRADLRGLLDDCPIADDAILCASEMAAASCGSARLTSIDNVFITLTLVPQGQINHPQNQRSVTCPQT